MAPPVAQWPHFVTTCAEPHTPLHPPAPITFMRYDPQTKNDVILEDSEIRNPPSSAPPALGYFARPLGQPLDHELPQRVPQCDSSGQQVQEQIPVDNTAPSHSVSLPSSPVGLSHQPVIQSMGARPHTLLQCNYPMRDVQKYVNPRPYALNTDWDSRGLSPPPNLEQHCFTPKKDIHKNKDAIHISHTPKAGRSEQREPPRSELQGSSVHYSHGELLLPEAESQIGADTLGNRIRQADRVIHNNGQWGFSPRDPREITQLM